MSKLSRSSRRSIAAFCLSPKSLMLLLVICLFALTGAVLAQDHSDNHNVQPTSETSPYLALEIERPEAWVLPISPALTREDGITLEWTGITAPGTTITGYDVWYRLDNGAWVFWDAFDSATTSALFTFPGPAGGRYYFEATTYNDVPQYEPRTGIVEASVIHDKLHLFEARQLLPLAGVDFQQ